MTSDKLFKVMVRRLLNYILIGHRVEMIICITDWFYKNPYSNTIVWSGIKTPCKGEGFEYLIIYNELNLHYNDFNTQSPWRFQHTVTTLIKEVNIF